jgi:hypothetical protein
LVVATASLGYIPSRVAFIFPSELRFDLPKVAIVVDVVASGLVDNANFDQPQNVTQGCP